jgi:hypothetical protein
LVLVIFCLEFLFGSCYFLFGISSPSSRRIAAITMPSISGIMPDAIPESHARKKDVGADKE